MRAPVRSDGGVTTTSPHAPATAARPSGAQPSAALPSGALRTVGWPAALALAVAAGLLAGALTSFGQTLLGDTPFQGLANAVSPWLVAPFLVGATARRSVTAALAGLLTCAAQVAGYYVAADLRGFAVGSASILLWSIAGVIGGPVFGMAGRLWRRTRSGDPRWAGAGAALLAGCWLAEALVTYLVVLRRPDEALVFALVAGLLVALLGRGGGHRALLIRLPVAVAAGAAGFAVLHAVVG